MKKETTKSLVLATVFIIIGLILPLITGQVKSIGNKLLPMHITVLIAGYVLDDQKGAIIGFVTPLIRFAFFEMPPLFPQTISTAFELAVCGFIAGFIFNKLQRNILATIPSVLLAITIGKIAWGLVATITYFFASIPFTWNIFITSAFINAIPGVILQLVLIPILVDLLKNAGIIK